MKAVWQGRALQAAARYGDHAPVAAVCCNVCRTCTTTNPFALAAGVELGAMFAVVRFGKRLVRR